jgi:hypothetical protein
MVYICIYVCVYTYIYIYKHLERHTFWCVARHMLLCRHENTMEKENSCEKKSKELQSHCIDSHSYITITESVVLFYYMFLRRSLFKNVTFKRLYSLSRIKTSFIL